MKQYPSIEPIEEWTRKFVCSDKFTTIQKECEKISLELYNKIKKKKFNCIVNNKYLNYKQNIAGYDETPRELAIVCKQLNLDSFRILEYIDRYGPQPIYDIGCGMNLFGNFYNVKGLDIVIPNQDQFHKLVPKFDLQFSESNSNSFPSCIAINSLHFVSIDKMSSMIKFFNNVITEDGLGYITFNMKMVIEKTDPNIVQQLNLRDPLSLKTYVNNIINNINLDVIEYQNFIDDTLLSYHDGIDGSVRLLFVKRNNIC